MHRITYDIQRLRHDLSPQNRVGDNPRTTTGFPIRPRTASNYRFLIAAGAALTFIAALEVPASIAQDKPPGWDTNYEVIKPPANTTIAPRSTSPDSTNQNSPTAAQQPTNVRLTALLTEGGRKITSGLVWRVFKQDADAREPPKLISTKKTANPVILLKPGKYVVNVAYGRAYLTKTITVQSGQEASENFVLNAGGLKLAALVDGHKAPKNSVRYDVLEGEPDQSGNRKTIITNTKPRLIIRLNAGIYRVISRYGDANATVRADVQVEAGKLTVATVSHSAATVTFKLVDRAGGEALPGVQWSIASPKGDVIKQSVGALPTHILAPGTYVVTAVSTSGTYQAEFAIEDGQMASVEVVMN